MPSPSCLARGPVHRFPASLEETWGPLLPLQERPWRWGWASQVGTAGRARPRKHPCSCLHAHLILWGKLEWIRDLLTERLIWQLIIRKKWAVMEPGTHDAPLAWDASDFWVGWMRRPPRAGVNLSVTHSRQCRTMWCLLYFWVYGLIF